MDFSGEHAASQVIAFQMPLIILSIISFFYCTIFTNIISFYIPISFSVCQFRAGAGVTVLGGCLYAIGGFDDNAPLPSCERYDPSTDKWELLSQMSCPRGWDIVELFFFSI